MEEGTAVSAATGIEVVDRIVGLPLGTDTSMVGLLLGRNDCMEEGAPVFTAAGSPAGGGDGDVGVSRTTYSKCSS